MQGDKIIIDVLREMGAQMTWTPTGLSIQAGSPLIGKRIDVNKMIDALPILAVLGCYATGTTTLYNGAIARQKESDRIAAIALELKKMGAQIEETPDGLIIQHSPLTGTTVTAHNDHRIALALAIAALGAHSTTTIEGTECIAKSYPTFVQDFQKIGAQIEHHLAGV